MKKLFTLLLCMALAANVVACDEEEAVESEEEGTEVEEEADEEQADEEAQHDEADEEQADEEEFAQAIDGEIVIRATQMGFEPGRIHAPAGEELTIKFERDIEETCMDSVVFPDLDIDVDLPVGETVTVEVTPEEGQELGFECRMGHGKSTIVGG